MYSLEARMITMQFDAIATRALALALMLIAIAEVAWAQDEAEHLVHGTVTDAQTAEPIPGVNVLVQGTTMGTITSTDGAYELAVPSDDVVLVFSFVGYLPQAIPVEGRAEIDVELEEDVAGLEELIVVGYGTQRATDVTGSISRVEVENMNKVSTPTIAQSLQGQTAGVFIKNLNAQPGENKTDINIRGFGEPLIIVDGVAVSEQVFQNIDPNDIAELNVLKDAASAAVYGARAGNGVILVETKRGLEMEPLIEYRGEVGAQFLLPNSVPDIVNAHEYMELRNMVWENEGREAPFSREEIELFKQHQDGSAPEEYPNVNMYDEVLKDYTPMTDHSLSVRGGTPSVSYFVSGNLLYQDGVLRSDDMKYTRYSLRSNINIHPLDRLEVGLDLSLNHGDYIGPRNQLEGEDWGEGQGIMARLRRWRPYWPVQPLPDAGHPRGAPVGHTETTNPINMMHIENVGYIDRESQYYNAKLDLNYDLGYGINTRVIFSYSRDKQGLKRYQKQSPEYQYDAESGEYIFIRNVNNVSEVRYEDDIFDDISMQAFLEANRNINDNHTIDGLLVAEYIADRHRYVGAWRQNYQLDMDMLIAGPDQYQYNIDGIRKGGRIGYVGRLSYNYSRKYSVEISSRLDGSPQFPEDRRWGIFPSASAGWQISEEGFISDNAALSFISHLRLRASYGKLGYDREGDYQYLATYSFSNPYIFSGTSITRGIKADQVPNPNITWEEMYLANIGLDFNMWNDQLEGTVEVFQRDRKNVLGVRQRDIPNVVGAEMPEENYQAFRNRGIDLMLSHRNDVGSISYRLGGNVSWNREKIISTDEPEFASKESERRNAREGRWTNEVWMYPSDGLFRSQDEIDNWADIDGRNNASIQPGDVKYIDTNGDGRISVEDMIIVGRGNQPRLTFAFNTSLEWKGFELFTLWQGASLFGFNLAGSEYRQAFNNNGAPLAHHLNDSYVPEGNEWRPANLDAKWPRLRQNPQGPSYASNVEQWWIDGSYLRLRQVQLSYGLPIRLIEGYGVRSLNVYAAVYNLLTFSALDFMDPEIDTDPKQFLGNYHPQMGSFNIGISMSF